MTNTVTTDEDWRHGASLCVLVLPPRPGSAGRFRKHFDAQLEVLELTDLDEMRPVRRGSTWVSLEAPYETGRDLPFTVTRIRMVRRDNVWKIEHVAVDTSRSWNERKLSEPGSE